MAYAMLKRSSMMKSMATGIGESWRKFASVAVGSDVVAAAPNVSLQKARTWDEGVSSQFSTTPLSDIFKGKKVVIFGLPGAFTGVCSSQHVPSYKKNIDKFKAKGVDSVICVSVNDPYTMNGWAEKLEAKEAIGFYGDFDGKFHKSLELDLDLSSALLGHRSTRWSAFVEDGKVKVLNVENVPSEFKVSGGEGVSTGEKLMILSKVDELTKDMTQATPAQELSAFDRHDTKWSFGHSIRGEMVNYMLELRGQAH